MIQIKQLARAIFELLPKEKKIQELIGQLEKLEEKIKTDEAIRIFLFDRQKLISKKQVLIKEIFSDKLPELSFNLISLLMAKNQLGEIIPLIQQLKRLRNQKFNLAETKIISASPLAATEKEKIEQIISQKTKKKIILKTEVDPKILAGLVVQIGDDLIDLSLNHQLKKLKEKLIV